MILLSIGATFSKSFIFSLIKILIISFASESVVVGIATFINLSRADALDNFLALLIKKCISKFLLFNNCFLAENRGKARFGEVNRERSEPNLTSSIFPFSAYIFKTS